MAMANMNVEVDSDRASILQHASHRVAGISG
jgi:hypothetical protein